jgi:signal transduction histidine kinase/ActR/RegA family two-component response regulator
MSSFAVVALTLAAAAAGVLAGLRVRRSAPAPQLPSRKGPASVHAASGSAAPETDPRETDTDIDDLLARHAGIERALWEANLLQEAILESATYIVVSTDRRGIVRTFNRAASTGLGYRAVDVVGRLSLDVFSDRDDVARCAATLSDELGRPVEAGFDVFVARARTGGVDEREWTLVRRDGSRFPALLSITALRIPGGDVTGFLFVASDLTERKRADALVEAYVREVETARDRIATQAHELERARDLALEATRAKSAFLATISHEIRTPMNGIIGLTTMLLDTPLADDQRDVGQTILQSADSLLTIINDVLDFSKVEAGKLTLEMADVDLRQITEDVIRLLGPSARDKALALDVSIDAQAPGRLRGDPSRLRQVLLNLVGNAIKFTPHGAVTVTVLFRERREARVVVEVSVADTGIGIDPVVQSRLFQAFTQADASTTRRYGGTGLGLAICKQIVELMGGAIGVDSALDHGSRFWFTVPFDQVQAEAPAPEAPPDAVARAVRSDATAAPLHVLLVEDNPVNQKVATRMLEKLGHRVDVASNGFEAVDAAARTSYDAVLMDCQMPELDGYGAAARIRASETSRRVPIVAVTANAAVDDRERCFESGMDDYLAKPLRLPDLSRVLDRWTRQTSQVA